MQSLTVLPILFILIRNNSRLFLQILPYVTGQVMFLNTKQELLICKCVNLSNVLMLQKYKMCSLVSLNTGEEV